jgi:hypothetical protein
MTSNITLEQHLETCTECRDGSRAPRTPEMPADVPAEVLLDGPPDDADLLLQRTLRHVRAGRLADLAWPPRRARWEPDLDDESPRCGICTACLCDAW